MPETVVIPPLAQSSRIASRGWKKLEGRMNSLTAKYAVAEGHLTSLVAQAVIAGTLADPKERRRLKDRIRRVLKELDDDGRRDGREMVDDAYRLGARIAKAEPVGPINRQGIALLQRNLAGRLSQATTHVGRRTDDVFRREGLRVAAETLGRVGQEAATQQMVRRLQKEGVTAFVDTQGRRWGLERYAAMALTTVTSEAIFQGTTNNMLMRGFDLVTVSNTPSPCSRCVSYDGRTYSLTGTEPTYPRLDVVFPLHPGCDHFVLPSPKGLHRA